jgi:hypothetical protein
MKKHIQNVFITLALLAFAALNSQLSTTHAQGTAFAYQGRLNNNGAPANGSYNLTFTLFNVNSGGSAVASPVITNGVVVTNGLFTVLVDFGPGVFTGATNWLEIAVETNGGGSFMTLAPRQQVAPTPYAIYSANAGSASTALTASSAGSVSGTVSASQLTGTIPSAQLSGSYSGPVALLNGANSFGGNGSGLTNINLAGVGPAGTFTLQSLYFAPVISYSTYFGELYGASAVLTADVNNDGKPDMIVAFSDYTNSLSVYYGAILVYTNAGNGTLVCASTNLDFNDTIQSVVMADFNGDSNLDMAVADNGQGFMVFQGNGDGTFTPILTNSLGTVNYENRVMAAEDINGDGYPDLIIGQSGASGTALKVLANFGGGAFAFTQVQSLSVAANSDFSYIATADVNGDGKQDFITVGSPGFVVYTNNGSGHFASAYTNSSALYAGATLGDVNGDGRPDLLAWQITAGSLILFTNSGGGIFGSNSVAGGITSTLGATVVTNSSGLVTYLGSINEISNSNILEVLTNDTHGNFTGIGAALMGSSFNTASGVQYLTAADLNGDGNPDFLANYYNGPSILEFLCYPQTLSVPNPIVLANPNNSISGFFSGNFTGTGSSLSNLNASQITSGTLSVAQLPSDVPLLDTNQTFSGLNTFSSLNNIFDAHSYTGSFFYGGFFNGNGGGLTNLNAAKLTGALPAINGAALTNTITAANYVYAYDTTTQTAAVANTFQNINFNSNAQTNGWTHTAGTSTFTNAQTGLYLVQYTAEGEITASSSTSISLIAVLNGTEIPGSQSSVSLATASLPTTLSKSFVVSVNTGGILQFQFAGSATTSELTGVGNGTTKPSIACTIIRIQ